MSTSYRVTDKVGNLIGTVADLASAKALVDVNLGADVKAVVSIANPCSAHPAYEADNCPSCGTSRMGN